MPLTDKYTPTSELTARLAGGNIGICGLGTKTCYDVVTQLSPERAQLFEELTNKHPDFTKELLDLSQELNKVFRERSKGILTRFKEKHPEIKGNVHVAAIGSGEGLYLAFATRIPPEDLLRSGAGLAREKLQTFWDQLVEPPAAAKPRKSPKA